MTPPGLQPFWVDSPLWDEKLDSPLITDDLNTKMLQFGQACGAKMLSAEIHAFPPPLFTDYSKTRGERLNHLGNPPDMSKYLEKIAFGADIRPVDNREEVKGMDLR